MQYQVARGRSVNRPGCSGIRGFKLIGPGEALPEGVFSPVDIEFLLKAGAIVALELAAPAGSLPNRVGKWIHDPAMLAGKTIDQLRAMVLDSDSSIHIDDLSEASLVQLLTSDFDPMVPAASSAKSVDRHRPATPALAEARRKAAGG